MSDDIAKLQRASDIARGVIDDRDIDIEAMREIARWLHYIVWKTDPNKPPWYGTPEELEYFRTAPNPFDVPADTNV